MFRLRFFLQARELFHAAFVSCWHELSEQYQDNLVRSLQKAFRSTTIPAGTLPVCIVFMPFLLDCCV